MGKAHDIHKMATAEDVDVIAQQLVSPQESNLAPTPIVCAIWPTTTWGRIARSCHCSAASDVMRSSLAFEKIRRPAWELDRGVSRHYCASEFA